MPLEKWDYIKREDLRKNPDFIFLFGDNLRGQGFGGQAREMRGEPNAVGIVTKSAPSMGEKAFLSDGDYTMWRTVVEPVLVDVLFALQKGKVVVLPKAGLGSGLAELREKAPKISNRIDKWVMLFEAIG